MWAMVCSLGLAYLESPSDGGLVRVLRTGWEIMLGRGGIVSAGPGVRVGSDRVRGDVLGGSSPVGAGGAAVASGVV